MFLFYNSIVLCIGAVGNLIADGYFIKCLTIAAIALASFLMGLEIADKCEDEDDC